SSRVVSGAPGLDRAAELHDRAAARQRRVGRRGRAGGRPGLDRLWGRAVRGRMPGLRSADARVQTIRCPRLDFGRRGCYQQGMNVRDAMTPVVLTAPARTTIAAAASLVAPRRGG